MSVPSRGAPDEEGERGVIVRKSSVAPFKPASRCGRRVSEKSEDRKMRKGEKERMMNDVHARETDQCE